MYIQETLKCNNQKVDYCKKISVQTEVREDLKKTLVTIMNETNLSSFVRYC